MHCRHVLASENINPLRLGSMLAFALAIGLSEAKWASAEPPKASSAPLPTAPADSPKKPSADPTPNQKADPKPVALPADHAERMARGLELFKTQVSDLLTTHCLKCHGGKKTEGEFDLSSREALLRGGSAGPAVVPFNSAESLLYKLVSHADEPGMPYETDTLPDAAISQFRDWIDSGAPYEKPLVAKGGAPKGRPIVTDEDRQFWSFLPLAKFAPPEVSNKAWCRTPIDRFILAPLEAKQLTPSPAVDRRKLIRRATFDLTGLPPTPEEIETFVNDKSADAYEKVVDRLLASPHYGERWARHWLDLARFAESHGYEQDYDRPFAYYYRDFVIRALNDDMPYDRFVSLQIAGDELEPDNPEAMMATGYLGAGTHATQITANQVEKERYDELDDMTATIGTSLLGLTIGCARCHDHKFDPIPQTDYYRLLSTFTTTVRSEMELDLHPERYREAKAKYDAEHAPLTDALAEFEKEQLPARLQQWLSTMAPSVDPRQAVLMAEATKSAAMLALARRACCLPLVETASLLATPSDQSAAALQNVALQKWFAPIDADWRKLNDAAAAHASKAPKPDLTKVMVCSEGVPAIRFHTQGGDFLEKTHVLKRGDPNQKLDEATQSFLQVLMTSPDKEQHWRSSPPAGWRTTYRRRSLAGWITDVDQGAGRMLARVIVNRLWQHHFGRGIVATPSDFGAQGERPTHPELLDWLAGELVREGWRLKPLHRQMMTSAAYMQGSEVQGSEVQGSEVQGTANERAALAADPDNRLFGRRPHRRLEAEAIRDSMLAASGELDAKMFGPGMLDQGMRRRSIYFTVKRSQLIPLMTLFDAPDSLQGLGNRGATTVAPQALAMMNNKHVQQYARALARRLLAQDTSGASVSTTPANEVNMIQRGYELALGRPPAADEIAAAQEFLKSQRESYAAAEKAAADKVAAASEQKTPGGGGTAQNSANTTAETGNGKNASTVQKVNPAAELALADFCQALFCLNEFMYVE